MLLANKIIWNGGKKFEIILIYKNLDCGRLKTKQGKITQQLRWPSGIERLSLEL